MAKQFKIATFNIFKDEGDFPKRVYNLPSLLKDIDIICLQEDYENENFSSSNIINKELNYFKYTIKTRQKLRNNNLSSSNLTILSRFKIISLNDIYFYKNTLEERAAQIVQIKIDDKVLILSNTHLCHLSSSRREKQIKQILNKLEKYKSNITIFCGDLNSIPKTKEIKVLEKRFKSINKEATFEDGTILDYIFYSTHIDFEISTKVITSSLSDHYLLINNFKEN